jgi:hypothetical protein
VEREEYDDLLRRLTTLVTHLDGYITRQDGYITRQESINEDLREFNRQQTAINERLERTLHAITLILARDNGR